MAEKKEGLPEYEPRVVGEWTNRMNRRLEIKLCHFDWCNERNYARGLCRGHHGQLLRGEEPRPFAKTVQKTVCDFEGCEEISHTKLNAINYCVTHHNHLWIHGEPRPIKYKVNGGYNEDETRRVCRDCGEDKPVTAYYQLPKPKGKNSNGYRTNCKECYKKDISYYQGREATKADGTDPLGWAENPAAKEEKFRATYDRQRKTSREYQQKKRQEDNDA